MHLLVVYIVMFGVFLYTIFRLYRNFEDEIVLSSSQEQTSAMEAKSFTDIIVIYLTSIFNFTAMFKCLPASIAVVQVSDTWDVIVLLRYAINVMEIIMLVLF